MHQTDQLQLGLSPRTRLASVSERKAQTFNPRREQRWDYPMAALREIVINMIVHREHRSANDSTIKIFDDRIEFFNPGVLLDGLSIEQIKTGQYKSHLRNKQIATIFKELEFIEKYGSGVRRVIEAFVAYGLPAPVLKATQGGVAVAVFKAPGRQPESQGGLLMEAKALRLLAAGSMSKKELSVALGHEQVSGQLNKRMRVLQASGQIEVTMPDKPNSRLQRYQLKDQVCQKIQKISLYPLL